MSTFFNKSLGLQPTAYISRQVQAYSQALGLLNGLIQANRPIGPRHAHPLERAAYTQFSRNTSCYKPSLSQLTYLSSYCKSLLLCRLTVKRLVFFSTGMSVSSLTFACCCIVTGMVTIHTYSCQLLRGTVCSRCRSVCYGNFLCLSQLESMTCSKHQFANGSSVRFMCCEHTFTLYVTCAVMWLPLFYCSVLFSIFNVKDVYKNSLDISLDLYFENQQPFAVSPHASGYYTSERFTITTSASKTTRCFVVIALGVYVSNRLSADVWSCPCKGVWQSTTPQQCF